MQAASDAGVGGGVGIANDESTSIQLAGGTLHRAGGDPALLTGRELVVLQLLARCYSVAQVGMMMGGVDEAERLVASATNRLGAPDARAALRRAMERSLVLGPAV